MHSYLRSRYLRNSKQRELVTFIILELHNHAFADYTEATKL